MSVLIQELVGLFSHETCPSCETCEFADNNCWYVTFDSEESTQKVYIFSPSPNPKWISG